MMFVCSLTSFISVQMMQKPFRQNTRSSLAIWKDFMVSFERFILIELVFCGNKAINMSRALTMLKNIYSSPLVYLKDQFLSLILSEI